MSDYVKKPEKEGETLQCPNCDNSLIARWTDYKGRWEDKLQWQDTSPRKAHYDKSGSCQNNSSVKEEEKPTKTSITTANTVKENADILYIKNKVDLMFAMISEQFEDYKERKKA